MKKKIATTFLLISSLLASCNTIVPISEYEQQVNLQAASEVIDLIGSLGQITLASKDKIEAAEKAYSNLTDPQKELVTNYLALTTARAEYNQLVLNEQDKASAKSVDDLIVALGVITLEKESNVIAARIAYDNLSSSQKNYVEHLQDLISAENRIAQLKAEKQAEEENKAAAKHVDDLIAALGTITLNKKEQVNAAKSAYDNLTDAQKAFVTKKDVLDQALDTITQLEKEKAKEEADKKAANDVVILINSLGEITLSKESQVNAAKTAYDALTVEQKAYVTNYSTLSSALSKIDQLKQEKAKQEADQEAANGVISLINGLGSVTLAKESNVIAARKAYDALTSDQKALVTNYSTLTAAEKTISELKVAQDKATAKNVDDLISAIGVVSLNSENAITSARNAYNALTSTQKQYVTKLDILTGAEATLASLKRVDNVIKKIDAIGKVTLANEANVVAARQAYDALSSDEKAKVTNYATLTAAEATIIELKLVDDGSIALSKTSITAVVGGGNETLTITKSPSTGGDLVIVNNSSSIFTVSRSTNTLTIIPLKTGSGTFRIKNSKYYKDVTVTVTELSLPSTITVTKGENSQIDGMSGITGLTYSISSPTVARVGTTGLITGLRCGTTTVTVTKGNLVKTATVEVTEQINVIEDFGRDSKYLTFYGRTYNIPSRVEMNNSASGFEVTFVGTSLSIVTNGTTWSSNTTISVMIDGQSASEATMKSVYQFAKNTCTLATGLTNGKHTVKVTKRCESGANNWAVYKVTTNGYFVAKTPTRKLRMEVYGDSISAGFGNLRPTADPDGTSPTIQDGNQTYGALAAQTLNADLSLFAKSGIGLYISEQNTGTDRNMVGMYNHMDPNDERLWNMSNYIPDIVVINLGTNDQIYNEWYNDDGSKRDTYNADVSNIATTRGLKFANDYSSNYLTLIKNIAAAYGDKTAFILCSGFWETNLDNIIQNYVITPLKSQGFKNPITNLQFTKLTYSGHPMLAEHITGASKLVEKIKAMGYDKIRVEDK